jgi:phospholipid-translocating ATPase
MNQTSPRQKNGLVDLEINWMTKVLFVGMMALGFAIQIADGFIYRWYFKYFRLVLLLSAIIPISMRVNLDFAKVYYSVLIQTDDLMMHTETDMDGNEKKEGCIPRTTTIPEELGRLSYLLSDKTGTLTQNDMVFKKVACEFA